MELYIHIPFCVRKCLYCDFLSGAYDKDVRDRYTNKICEEIEYYGRGMKDASLSSVYIGGGTPSWLEVSSMDRILETVYDSFRVEDDAEITLECNPGTAVKDAFKNYRDMGINRLSIGLQSANDDELKLLGRIHDFNQFLRTYEYAREAGFFDISVDIMTGLPYQDKRKLYYTLMKVGQLKPEHVSAYSLMIEEGTPFYDTYNFDSVKQQAGMPTEMLPNEDQNYGLTKLTEQFLEEHGYLKYEISNFAKEGFEGKHNTGYWKRVPYLGVGIGAASFLKRKTDVGTEEIRTKNISDMEMYLKTSFEGTYEEGVNSSAWEEPDILTRKDAMAEFMYLGLRMTEGITRDEFEDAFHVTIESIYGPVIKNAVADGLMTMSGGRIALTETGMDVSNRVLAGFLL